MSANDVADEAVDAWIAAMSPASANPTAIRDAMRPLVRSLATKLTNRTTVTKATDTTITATAYASLMTANITTTVANSYLDISLSASGVHITNAATTYFQLVVDSVPVKGAYSTVAANFAFCVSLSARVAVSAGAHTVLIEWKTDTDSARINASSVVEEHAHLFVQESF